MKICHIKAADTTIEINNRFIDLVLSLADIGIEQSVLMAANRPLENILAQKGISCLIQKFSGLFDLRTQQAAQRAIDGFDPHIIQTHTPDAAALAAKLPHHAVRIGFTGAAGAQNPKIGGGGDLCFSLSHARPGPPLDYNILPVPPLVRDLGVVKGEGQDREELQVGALVDLDGTYLIEPVLQAMREIPDMRLHLPDTGPQRKQLELAARRQAVHDRLVFRTDAMSPHDFLSALDICVVPFRATGIDRLTLEAWSCGICVISGMPQDRSPVTDRKNGILIDRNEALVWRGELKNLLADRTGQVLYGRAGRAQYDKAHNAARIVPGYLQAYETALRIKV